MGSNPSVSASAASRNLNFELSILPARGDRVRRGQKLRQYLRGRRASSARCEMDFLLWTVWLAGHRSARTARPSRASRILDKHGFPA